MCVYVYMCVYGCVWYGCVYATMTLLDALRRCYWGFLSVRACAYACVCVCVCMRACMYSTEIELDLKYSLCFEFTRVPNTHLSKHEIYILARVPRARTIS